MSLSRLSRLSLIDLPSCGVSASEIAQDINVILRCAVTLKSYCDDPLNNVANIQQGNINETSSSSSSSSRAMKIDDLRGEDQSSGGELSEADLFRNSKVKDGHFFVVPK